MALRSILRLAVAVTLVTPLLVHGSESSDPEPLALDVSNPSSPVKLVFIHHSTGENWLRDADGRLGLALRDANYFVSDTNYGWGPFDQEVGSGTIGDHTDVGNYYTWFLGPSRQTYLTALYAESNQNAEYARLGTDPGGENEIVMFKSCFPNSGLRGSLTDPVPPISSNPLRNQDCWSEAHTFANVKGIYQSLLTYFATRQDRLFVLVTSPPLGSFETSPEQAALARAMSEWLRKDWLASYPYRNVFVFDFFNVNTSDGGSTRTNDPNANDLGWADGNHHRYRSGAIEHLQSVSFDMSAYPSGDSHPSQAGNLKATGELRELLNIAYHCWQGTGSCPTYSTASCTVACDATVPSTAIAGSAVYLAGSATLTGCVGSATYDWDFGDFTTHGTSQNVTHTYPSAGSYPWTLVVTADGTSCTRTGTITVSGGGATTCTADATTLCLNGSRFKVQATWRNYSNQTGTAQAQSITSDTGYFWFFAQTNIEVMIKVLDFCGGPSATWSVYGAGLTDVEVTLRVTDTTSGATRTYTNPLGTQFVMIRDGAFACP